MQTSIDRAPFKLDNSMIDTAPDFVIATAAAYERLAADCRVEEWPADFMPRDAQPTENLLNMLQFA